jgi:hypothetical protein
MTRVSMLDRESVTLHPAGLVRHRSRSPSVRLRASGSRLSRPAASAGLTRREWKQQRSSRSLSGESEPPALRLHATYDAEPRRHRRAGPVGSGSARRPEPVLRGTPRGPRVAQTADA